MLKVGENTMRDVSESITVYILIVDSSITVVLTK